MEEMALKVGKLHDLDNDIEEYLAKVSVETDGVYYEFENNIEFYVTVFLGENSTKDILIKALGINEDDLQEFEIDILRNSLDDGIRVQGIALNHALSTAYGIIVESIPVTQEDIYVLYR